MHRMRAVVRNLVPIGVVAALVTCSDQHPTVPGLPLPPSFEFVVSEPAGVPVGASAAAARNATGAQTGDSIVYVSLLPGTVLSGRSVAIRNLTMGFSATAEVVDGGFDPVPLVAGVGDSVEVVITDGSGGTTRAALRVPARRPPIIVRTVPPKGGTDIPLNSLIRVVFSEPMDPRTITTGTVRLLRSGTPVAGRVELAADGLRADFVPDTLLARLTGYLLVVEADAADLSGDALGQTESVDFGTGNQSAAAPVGSVTVAPASATLPLGGTLSLRATLRDAAGNEITGRPITWTSSNQGVATVAAWRDTSRVDDAQGVVTAVGSGSAFVIATSEFVGGGASITVPSDTAGGGVPVASVVVTPDTVTAHAGTGYLFWIRVTVRDTQGIDLGGVPVTWTSTDTSLARIVNSTVGDPGRGRFGGAVVFGTGLTGRATISATVPGTNVTGRVVVVLENLADVPLSSISTGASHPCFVTISTRAFCWGEDTHGEIGWGGPTNATFGPVAVRGGHAFRTISADGGHACALTTTGAAYCWGWNRSGAVGDGSTIDRSVPTPVSGGLSFTQLALGGDYTCGLTVGGAAYCWGQNNTQLGDGTWTDRWTPAAVAGGLTFSRIDADRGGTCGLTTSGDLYCWGYGYSDSVAPVPVAVATGLGLTDVSVGSSQVCGLTAQGAPLCWQVRTVPPVPLPVSLPAGVTLTQIAGGLNHTCGVATDGSVYCWGWTLSGGDWSDLVPFGPTRVQGQTFQSVSSGSGGFDGLEGVACGVGTDRVGYCWFPWIGQPWRVTGGP